LASNQLCDRQRALLVPEADGCVMWDCVPLVTPEGVDYVRSLGGLKAIAVFASALLWRGRRLERGVRRRAGLSARRRSRVRHAAASAIVRWTGDNHRISDGIMLVRTAGHFAGGTILHWRAGAGGQGCAAHR